MFIENSGKTQKQLRDLVSNSNFKRTSFVRASRRATAGRAPGDKSWTPPVVPPVERVSLLFFVRDIFINTTKLLT